MRKLVLKILKIINLEVNSLTRILSNMSDNKEKEAAEQANSSNASEASGSNERDSISGSGATSFSVEALRRYLAVKLGFVDQEQLEKVKVLDDVSLDGIVDYIKSEKCKNIITMAGAGISTSAGIPDFRSPGTGLYHNLQKYNLPDPQSIFELSFFQHNPKPFFVLAKELYPGSFKPTICHYFVKLLNEKGYLLRHYTQNIDTLERVAGIEADKLVEAHGTFHMGHCILCNREYSLEWMKEHIFNDEIPICKKCPGVVKPDIVFFGENLPKKFHKSILVDFPKCDLLIILGSSLVVQPFASLIDKVPPTSPRLLINREKAGNYSPVMSYMGMGSGLDFESEDNARDVCWLGDCDAGCQLLAEKLGWGDELIHLVEKEHKRIDEETKQKVKAPKSPKNKKKKETESKEHKQKDKEKTKEKIEEASQSKDKEKKAVTEAEPETNQNILYRSNF